MRRFLLCATTSLHYLSLIPNTFFIYKMLIFTSTSLSFLWHYYNEPKNILFYLDYGMAILWSVYDFYLVFNADHFYMISLIFLLNKMIDKCDEKKYVYYHSLWHIISALKSLFIAASVTIKALQN